MEIAYLGVKSLPAQAGADKVVEAIISRVPALGVHPTVYCDRQTTPPDTSIDGVRLIRLPALPGKYLRAPSLFLFAASHALTLGNYDLIHLHNIEAGFVLPLLRLRYRVISTSHGFAYWRAKWGPLAKRLIRFMDWPFARFSTAITCVSAKDKDSLVDRFGRKVSYIPNGVSDDHSPDTITANTILQGLGVTAGEYFIFVAGRIEPTKGAHIAIEAVNSLEKKVPLLIVGDDQQVPEYSKKLRQLAGPSVHFHPLIKDPEILFGLMANARGLIFPSTVEAMSMVLLEAAAIGAPIVCSDIPENRAVLKEDTLYFEMGNSISLAEQLDWMLQNQAKSQQISQNAKSKIQRDFSWDTITSQYVHLYQSVNENGHKAARLI